jgi:hypothetical protein
MNERFVPFVTLTHRTGDLRYDQWWVDNVKETLPEGRVAVGAHLFTITASGKPIPGGEHPGGKGTLRKQLDFKLRSFARFPANERKPSIGDPTPLRDVERLRDYLRQTYRVPPPPNGLVLTSYKRFLNRDGQGRYGRLGEPFTQYRVTDFGQTWCPFVGMCSQIVSWMWLSEQESKALVPIDPKQGDTVQIPRALRLRLLLMHLGTTRGEDWAWRSPEVVRTDSLVLRVLQVSPREVRLRLTGAVLLMDEGSGKLPNWAAVENPGQFASWMVKGMQRSGAPQKGLPEKYHKQALDAGVEGILIYDRQDRKFTRFDVVVLGDAWGLTFGGLTYTRWPIGFCFELDQSDSEPGRSRGVPWRAVSHRDAYWNPDVLLKGYQAKEPYYTYPEPTGPAK